MEEVEPRPAVAPKPPVEKSFIGSLLDFSFESFVTPKLVRFLYVLALLCVVGLTVRWIFDRGLIDLIWRTVLSPFVLVVGAILARVFVELIMVAFRILELLRRIDAERQKDAPKV
jgi:hypothetical protein